MVEMVKVVVETAGGRLSVAVVVAVWAVVISVVQYNSTIVVHSYNKSKWGLIERIAIPETAAAAKKAWKEKCAEGKPHIFDWLHTTCKALFWPFTCSISRHPHRSSSKADIFVSPVLKKVMKRGHEKEPAQSHTRQDDTKCGFKHLDPPDMTTTYYGLALKLENLPTQTAWHINQIWKRKIPAV